MTTPEFTRAVDVMQRGVTAAFGVYLATEYLRAALVALMDEPELLAQLLQESW